MCERLQGHSARNSKRKMQGRIDHCQATVVADFKNLIEAAKPALQKLGFNV
jgi:hypothetical protein